VASRYRLLDRLGAGGMSVVWRAHDEVLDREVAVKVLAPDKAAGAKLLDRIRIEARSAARLRHPHVVEVHDFGETEAGWPFVVMELVEGRSLADLLTRGPLPWRTAVMAGAQVADALSAAHARGIVHRDVKPSNVMVTADGVKLVDFGISASVGEADGIGGEVYGTPAYLAPERIGGDVVRPATDVYALGLLLYLMLAGRLPWDASTTTQMLRAHCYADPAALPPVPGLPSPVSALIRRCLAKRPGDRPSAQQAAGILADAAGLAAQPSLLATLTAPTTALPVHRRPRMLAGAVAAALLAAGGAGWIATRPGPPAASPPAAEATIPAARGAVGAAPGSTDDTGDEDREPATQPGIKPVPTPAAPKASAPKAAAPKGAAPKPPAPKTDNSGKGSSGKGKSGKGNSGKGKSGKG
jgi:serine/threonine-protein kinase